MQGFNLVDHENIKDVRDTLYRVERINADIIKQLYQLNKNLSVVNDNLILMYKRTTDANSRDKSNTGETK